MKLTIVGGARPNFVKIAPIIKAIQNAQKNGAEFELRIVHTGQHYDYKMSGAFFEELGIPEPDSNLEVGSGSQSEQTAAVMCGFEKELISHRPDLVIVVGDVTSTMACTIAAKKLNIRVAHVEAGIRSGDMQMPEEINRIVTDSIADYFFTTTRQAGMNLLSFGVDSKKIFFVGNTMIDSLLENLDRLRKPAFFDHHNLGNRRYLVVTLHRPGNVDESERLKDLLSTILESSPGVIKVFPVHPRTQKKISEIDTDQTELLMVEPLSYLEFIYLIRNALGIVTDSGGITEEATVLQIPCMTLRDSTERPETVEIGTNELIGYSRENLVKHLEKLIAGKWKKGSIPELWDGNTGTRIVEILKNMQTF